MHPGSKIEAIPLPFKIIHFHTVKAKAVAIDIQHFKLPVRLGHQHTEGVVIIHRAQVALLVHIARGLGVDLEYAHAEAVIVIRYLHIAEDYPNVSEVVFQFVFLILEPPVPGAFPCQRIVKVVKLPLLDILGGEWHGHQFRRNGNLPRKPVMPGFTVYIPLRWANDFPVVISQGSSLIVGKQAGNWSFLSATALSAGAAISSMIKIVCSVFCMLWVPWLFN